MASAVIMPRQGQSVESCVIGTWHKQKGDKVSVGDILFTYETDKATFEEEAKVEGVMLEVFFEEGDDVECLVNVCVIGSEGESVEEFRPSVSGASKSTAPSEVSAPAPDPSSLQEHEAIRSPSPVLLDQTQAIKVSPRAKRLVERTRADLSYAVPTGANGRIIERDVQAVLSQGLRDDKSQGKMAPAKVSDDADVEIVALSNVRKFIAKAMHKSLSESAQLTNHSSFDATNILEFRKKLKASSDSSVNITVNDIIIFAVSRVIHNHKNINAHFLGDKMTLFKNAHIGVAVDTPRGLLVPTIFYANTMSLRDISVHAKDVFEKCKQGAASPDLLKGASFTISNLGGMGIEMFTPILNPPQTGLLGVCSIIERTRGGKPYPAMGLSVTYDHRAIDGADAARFAKDLAEYLEDFSTNLFLEYALAGG